MMYFLFSFPCFLSSFLFLLFLPSLLYPSLYCVRLFSSRSFAFYAFLCTKYVVAVLRWQGVYSAFPGASSEKYAPVWTWHNVGDSRDHFLYVFGEDMNCVSCGIVYTWTIFGLLLFISWDPYSTAPG